ncbi:type II toxin-antitoxin system RatA family toxin [Sandaracinobacter sp. RS1-74]|uniref:type II toxin-antitoxin system RatA family toxin n=1 Tax=Sandaracinobacteroides sayramensis TaxID=2913411 RepID=UPI001ED9DF85|nr:type II toxin-antitoxin system RatA family toxin [Sandaracinobacteroides sayramensis]MCG2840042.1 type II toxin-antitoxin system RatA family toxin [Sandaracinobacteroides sayramensis]
MPRHSETRHLPWTPEELFDLVADVRRYPEFLPWVAAVRIRSSEPGLLVADMAVGFKSLKETFTSRVNLDRPYSIEVDYISGPLKRLHNDWRFQAAEKGGTNLEFHVDFEFKSKIFEKLAGAFFHEAFKHMVASFETRAAKLYGSRSLSATSAA